MEALNLILGILASLLSIYAVVTQLALKSDLAEIKKQINSGDNSKNIIGDGNRLS